MSQACWNLNPIYVTVQAAKFSDAYQFGKLNVYVRIVFHLLLEDVKQVIARPKKFFQFAL